MENKMKQRLTGIIVVVVILVIGLMYLFGTRAPAPAKVTVPDTMTASSEPKLDTGTPEIKTQALALPNSQPDQSVSPSPSPSPASASASAETVAPPVPDQSTPVATQTTQVTAAPVETIENNTHPVREKANAPVAEPDTSAAPASTSPPLIMKPVQQESARAAEKNERKWIVQLSGLSSAEQARLLMKKLQKSGFTVSIRKTFSKNHNPIFYVIVGGEPNRKAAKQLALRLNRVTQLQGTIRTL